MKKKPEIIDLSADSDDEGATFNDQVHPALEASKFCTNKPVPRTVVEESTSSTPQPQPQSNAAPSFLSERAQMEKERLERQKRLRPEAHEGDRNGADDKEEPELREPPAKRQHLSSSSGRLFNDVRNYTVPSIFSAKGNPPTEGIPTIDQVFWDGELRQTANRHAEPRKDGRPTFRLTEILGQVRLTFSTTGSSSGLIPFPLQRTELSFAIMSSYALDFPWIYQFFDPAVPVIMVAQPDANGQASLKNVLPNWLRTTPFLRGGRGCMHMKVGDSLSQIDHHLMSAWCSSCSYVAPLSQ